MCTTPHEDNDAGDDDGDADDDVIFRGHVYRYCVSHTHSHTPQQRMTHRRNGGQTP